MMKRKQKRRPGRRPLPEGRVKFTTTLPESVIQYLMKAGNASRAIIELVEADRRRTSADNQGVK